MFDFIFSTVWGWIGTAGLIVIVCLVAGYLFPRLRVAALAIGAAAIYAASIYSKGSRDRARIEARRKEEAVARARKAYDAINKRPDTADDVVKRMRNNDF